MPATIATHILLTPTPASGLHPAWRSRWWLNRELMQTRRPQPLKFSASKPASPSSSGNVTYRLSRSLPRMANRKPLSRAAFLYFLPCRLRRGRVREAKAMTAAEPSMFWDQLIELIDEKHLIPVVGQDLLTIPAATGQKLICPLYCGAPRQVPRC